MFLLQKKYLPNLRQAFNGHSKNNAVRDESGDWRLEMESLPAPTL
jgi:hypothetical protein